MTCSPGAMGGKKGARFCRAELGKASVPRVGPARAPSPNHPLGPGTSGNGSSRATLEQGKEKLLRAATDALHNQADVPILCSFLKMPQFKQLSLRRGRAPGAAELCSRL